MQGTSHKEGCINRYRQSKILFFHGCLSYIKAVIMLNQKE